MPSPAPSTTTRDFARRLKACRQAAGFETAEAAADHLKVASARYRSYERGSREPSFDLLIRMSDMVGKSIDFLLRGAAPNRPTP
jgi:transcriptional regulator with XRE-family HTH domain